MKNKVSILLSLLLMIAGTYAPSAQAQTRSSGAIRPPQVTTQTTPAPRNPAPAISSGTPKPSVPSGCRLQIGDGLPTQSICPGSAAGTSTSGNTNNGAASGGQTTCPGYVFAGDGSGITVAQANAINAAADAARRNGACRGNTSGALSHQPAGTLTNTNSPNPNGRQGYANSLAGSAPTPSSQASVAADSSGDTGPQAVDPEAFKAAGSDAVATNMDALINGSTAAAPSIPAGDSGPTDMQLSTADTILEEIHTSAEQIPEAIDNFRKSGFWNATVNFLSTEVEADLSGAITDIGGVFIDLEKGLLDPGTALGVKAIADQANDQNKFLNAAERSQMCAVMPDTCPPAKANQPATPAPQPKQP